jgi:ribosome-associated heat shock protein Hsp15
MNPAAEVRVDKWLWAARLYKTRGLALEACRGGHVRVGGLPAKPGRPVRLGDVISARAGGLNRTVKVLAVIAQRVGPKAVPDVYEDLTPAEELERPAPTLVQQILARDPGMGRPTKRDRRLIDELFG